MQRSNTSTEISQPATTGATASTIEGGLGYLADIGLAAANAGKFTVATLAEN
jgi:hypothetical protein